MIYSYKKYALARSPSNTSMTSFFFSFTTKKVSQQYNEISESEIWLQ